MVYQTVHHELVASDKVVKIGHEINPNFQIGCMMARVPIYPYSCHPDDMMLGEEEMRKRWHYADVHARGAYGNYTKKLWERKGLNIVMEPEDERILKEGSVDYIGISYYMLAAVKSNQTNLSKDEAFKHFVRNPYIQESD